MHKMTPEWKCSSNVVGGVNYCLNCDGFYISFNPNPGFGMSLFGSDNGGPETALCKDDDFFILNGDFREDYERLAPQGFAACKAFFDQQTAHRSSWSN